MAGAVAVLLQPALAHRDIVRVGERQARACSLGVVMAHDVARTFRNVLLASTAGFSTLVLNSGAGYAQFCPTTIPNPGAVSLQGGNCTNGNTGAFSNAALGSQALSDLSQSGTQATTDTAGRALAERREEERRRTTTAPAAPAARPAAAPVRRAGGEDVTERRRAAPRTERREAAPREPVYKGPVYVEPAVRFGTWTQVYGDY